MLEQICLTDKLEDNFYRLFPVPFDHHRCCQLLFSTSSPPQHLIRPNLPMAEHLSTDGLQLSDIAVEGITAYFLKSSEYFLSHMIFNLLHCKVLMNFQGIITCFRKNVSSQRDFSFFLTTPTIFVGILTTDERVVTEQSGKAVTPVGGTQDPGPLVSQVKSPVGRNAKAKPSLQARVHCTACSSSVQFLCPLIGSLGRLHE